MGLVLEVNRKLTVINRNDRRGKTFQEVEQMGRFLHEMEHKGNTTTWD